MWLVAGRGRRLPEGLFTSMLTRVADVRAPWEAEAEAAPVGLFGAIVGPDGVFDLGGEGGAGDPAAAAAAAAAGLAPECPMAHELLRTSAI